MAADRTPTDLADALEADAESLHNLDDMAYDGKEARLRAAAALLRQLTERLEDSWYTDIGQRLDDVTAERDEYRRQLDTLRNAIGDPDLLRDALDWIEALEANASLYSTVVTVDGQTELAHLLRRLLAEIHATHERSEVELGHLRRWKEEATEVLCDWDRVHRALGSPGELGQSKAHASFLEAERLRVNDV